MTREYNNIKCGDGTIITVPIDKMKQNTSNNDEHDSAGYVDEWNIRDEKDVHPSHKTEVWTKEEISRLTAHWLENGIRQGYAKAQEEFDNGTYMKQYKAIIIKECLDNIEKELHDLQVFFECDIWYAKSAEWKTEKDMWKYLRVHFDIIRKSLAKLSHNQQDGTRCSSMKDKDMISTSQMEKQFESVSPADTNIPKLLKEKTK